MSYPEVVYQTHAGWLAGGFAVVALSCLAILPSYWGWWLLGRLVTTSPLDVAMAFDAPLLRDADPNGTADKPLRVVGYKHVRYGVAPLTLGRSNGLPESTIQVLSLIHI